MNYEQISEQLASPVAPKLRAWLFGNLVWAFGAIDRSIAALTDGSLSFADIGQLAIVGFFWLGWLYLKPKPKSSSKAIARTGFAQVLLQSTRKVISEN